MKTIRIENERSKAIVSKLVQELPVDGSMVVEIKKFTRTIADNAVQWPILAAFSDQLLWPVNGVMVKLSPDDWKSILTASYRNETGRVAQGLDGGMVFLGHKTSKFKHSEWGEWMSFLEWAAADRDVKIPVSKSQLKAMGLSDG